jgi:hypothetical protein
MLVEAHQMKIFISDFSEHLESLISKENLFSIFGLIEIIILILNFDGQALFSEFWLLVAATTRLRVADSPFL